MVGTYIHPGAKMAAMVEVGCETDFVARTEQFQQLAYDLAMHMVASVRSICEPERDSGRRCGTGAGISTASRWPTRASLPTSSIRLWRASLDKWFAEGCLLEQPFVKDPDVTIQDLLTETIASTRRKYQDQPIRSYGDRRLIVQALPSRSAGQFCVHTTRCVGESRHRSRICPFTHCGHTLDFPVGSLLNRRFASRVHKEKRSTMADLKFQTRVAQIGW